MFHTSIYILKISQLFTIKLMSVMKFSVRTNMMSMRKLKTSMWLFWISNVDIFQDNTVLRWDRKWNRTIYIDGCLNHHLWSTSICSWSSSLSISEDPASLELSVNISGDLTSHIWELDLPPHYMMKMWCTVIFYQHWLNAVLSTMNQFDEANSD